MLFYFIYILFALLIFHSVHSMKITHVFLPFFVYSKQLFHFSEATCNTPLQLNCVPNLNNNYDLKLFFFNSSIVLYIIFWQNLTDSSSLFYFFILSTNPSLSFVFIYSMHVLISAIFSPGFYFILLYFKFSFILRHFLFVSPKSDMALSRKKNPLFTRGIKYDIQIFQDCLKSMSMFIHDV